MIDDRVLLLDLPSLRERLAKVVAERCPGTGTATADPTLFERPAWAFVDWDAVEREAAHRCPREGDIWIAKREDSTKIRESCRLWQTSELSLPPDKRWELLLEAASAHR